MSYATLTKNSKNNNLVCYHKNTVIYKEDEQETINLIYKKIETIFTNCFQYDLKSLTADSSILVCYDNLMHQIKINYSFTDEKHKYEAKCHILTYLTDAYSLFVEEIKEETIIKIYELIKYIFPLPLQQKLLQDLTEVAKGRNVTESHIEILELNLSEVDLLMVKLETGLEYLKKGKLKLFYKTIGDILYINPHCLEALHKKIYVNLQSRLVIDEFNLYRYEVVLSDITRYLQIDPFCDWMLNMRGIVMTGLLTQKVSHRYNLDDLANHIINDSNKTFMNGIKLYSYTICLLWSRVKAYEQINDSANKDYNLILIERILNECDNTIFIIRFNNSKLIYYDLGILKFKQKDYFAAKDYFKKVLEISYDHREALNYIENIEAITTDVTT